MSKNQKFEKENRKSCENRKNRLSLNDFKWEGTNSRRFVNPKTLKNWKMFFMQPGIQSKHFRFTIKCHSFTGVMNNFSLGICDINHEKEAEGKDVYFGHVSKKEANCCGIGFWNNSEDFAFPNERRSISYKLFAKYTLVDGDELTVEVNKKIGNVCFWVKKGSKEPIKFNSEGKPRLDFFGSHSSVRHPVMVFDDINFLPEVLVIAISPRKKCDVELIEFIQDPVIPVEGKKCGESKNECEGENEK